MRDIKTSLFTIAGVVGSMMRSIHSAIGTEKRRNKITSATTVRCQQLSTGTMYMRCCRPGGMVHPVHCMTNMQQSLEANDS